MDLQIAAIFLCPARQDEVVTGLDLEVFSLILVLVGREKKLHLNFLQLHIFGYQALDAS